MKTTEEKLNYAVEICKRRWGPEPPAQSVLAVLPSLLMVQAIEELTVQVGRAASELTSISSTLEKVRLSGK